MSKVRKYLVDYDDGEKGYINLDYDDLLKLYLEPGVKILSVFDISEPPHREVDVTETVMRRLSDDKA